LRGANTAKLLQLPL